MSGTELLNTLASNELAKALPVYRDFIARLAAGETLTPTETKTLAKLVDAIGIEPINVDADVVAHNKLKFFSLLATEADKNAERLQAEAEAAGRELNRLLREAVPAARSLQSVKAHEASRMRANRSEYRRLRGENPRLVDAE